MEKTAMALLVDYRSGALGRISLETPESRQNMVSNLAAIEEVKDAAIPDESAQQD
jgi:ribosome biogenesis GTPase A